MALSPTAGISGKYGFEGNSQVLYVNLANVSPKQYGAIKKTVADIEKNNHVKFNFVWNNDSLKIFKPDYKLLSASKDGRNAIMQLEYEFDKIGVNLHRVVYPHLYEPAPLLKPYMED